MTKILPCRFMQCFVHYNVLTVHKCSNTWVFRHLSNPAFCSLYFQKKITSEAHLFWRYSKLYVEIGNVVKSSENIFWFGNNCIGIGCAKHSLLLRENTCHPVSICLQACSRFEILLKRHFWSWFFSRVVKKYVKNTAVQIYAVFRTV